METTDRKSSFLCENLCLRLGETFQADVGKIFTRRKTRSYHWPQQTCRSVLNETTKRCKKIHSATKQKFTLLLQPPPPDPPFCTLQQRSFLEDKLYVVFVIEGDKKATRDFIILNTCVKKDHAENQIKGHLFKCYCSFSTNSITMGKKNL